MTAQNKVNENMLHIISIHRKLLQDAMLEILDITRTKLKSDSITDRQFCLKLLDQITEIANTSLRLSNTQLTALEPVVNPDCPMHEIM